MKFLIIARPRPGTSFSSAMVQADKETINRFTNQGVNDCVFSFTSGAGGVGISNATSHEDLTRLLMEIPGYFSYEWEVHPLSDFNKAADNLCEALKRQGM